MWSYSSPFAPIVGAEPSAEFSKTVSAAVSQAYADKTIRAEMSPGASAALDLTYRSLIHVSNGQLSQLTDELTSLALITATNILRSATEAVGMSTLAGVIPLLGGFAAAIGEIATGPQAHGLGYTPEEQKAFCSSPAPEGWFRQIPSRGTAGGALVACDMLVRDSGWNANGKRWIDPTEMSWVIQLITETEGFSGTYDTKSYFGYYGLPPERRKIYENLRRSIQDTHKRHGTDGGATLWIVYVDMLRADFDAGRLSESFMRYMHILEGGAHNDATYMLGDMQYRYNEDTGSGHTASQHAADKRDIASILISDTPWSEGKGHGLEAAQKYAGEELIPEGRALMLCGLWTGAARKQVRDLLTSWRETLDPYYVQFDSLETAAKKAADDYFGDDQFINIGAFLPRKVNWTLPALLTLAAGGAFVAFYPATALMLYKSGIGYALTAKRYALTAGKSALSALPKRP